MQVDWTGVIPINPCIGGLLIAPCQKQDRLLPSSALADSSYACTLIRYALDAPRASLDTKADSGCTFSFEVLRFWPSNPPRKPTSDTLHNRTIIVRLRTGGCFEIRATVFTFSRDFPEAKQLEKVCSMGRFRCQPISTRPRIALDGDSASAFRAGAHRSRLNSGRPPPYSIVSGSMLILVELARRAARQLTRYATLSKALCPCNFLSNTARRSHKTI